MPPLNSNNHKNTCIRPDSIASAADSDLDALISGDGPFTSGRRRKSCPMHKGGPGAPPPKIISIPPDTSTPPLVQVSKGPKQLKGILKGGKSNITPNPLSGGGVVLGGVGMEGGSSREGSFSDSTPPPLADAVHISKAPKPPLRTSSSMNSKNVSEALHV